MKIKVRKNSNLFREMQFIQELADLLSSISCSQKDFYRVLKELRVIDCSYRTFARLDLSDKFPKMTWCSHSKKNVKNPAISFEKESAQIPTTVISAPAPTPVPAIANGDTKQATATPASATAPAVDIWAQLAFTPKKKSYEKYLHANNNRKKYKAVPEARMWELDAMTQEEREKLSNWERQSYQFFLLHNDCDDDVIWDDFNLIPEPEYCLPKI